MRAHNDAPDGQLLYAVKRLTRTDVPEKRVIPFLLEMPSDAVGDIDFGYDDEGAKPETAHSSIINNPAQDAAFDFAADREYASATAVRPHKVLRSVTASHAQNIKSHVARASRPGPQVPVASRPSTSVPWPSRPSHPSVRPRYPQPLPFSFPETPPCTCNIARLSPQEFFDAPHRFPSHPAGYAIAHERQAQEKPTASAARKRQRKLRGTPWKMRARSVGRAVLGRTLRGQGVAGARCPSHLMPQRITSTSIRGAGFDDFHAGREIVRQAVLALKNVLAEHGGVAGGG